MEAMQITTKVTPCCGPIPDLEGPMINSMVTCLGNDHRRLDGQLLQLACAATRLAADPESVPASQCARELWDEIRHDLWSHLQIEDELVLSWGGAHHAISATLLDSLKSEREEMRKFLAALPASSAVDCEPQTVGDRGAFAQTLLDLARTLDSHVERCDREVLPSILRALFHK